MEAYSKTRLIQNIAYLMRLHGVKVGELETGAEVSTGYLSRLKNNESEDTCPSIDILMRMGNILHTNVFVLLYCDLANLTETETFIYKFLENLLKQTTDNKVCWDKITVNSLTNYLYSDKPHLLMRQDLGEEIIYDSDFTEDYVYLDGPAYKLERSTQDFYITKIKHKFSDNTLWTDYELYIYKNGMKRKVCNATKESKKLFNTILPLLYDAAAVSSNILKIDDEVQKGLTDFMEDKDNEDLPF